MYFVYFLKSIKDGGLYNEYSTEQESVAAELEWKKGCKRELLKIRFGL